MRTRAVFLSILIFLSVVFPAGAQENSVMIRTFTSAVQDPSQGSDENTITVIGYYDTAGRLRQTLRKGFAPDGSDLVDYDALGRKIAEYDPIPVTGNNGRFVEKSVFQQGSAWKREYDYALSAQNRMTSAAGLHYGGGNIACKYGLNSDVSTEYTLHSLIPVSVGFCRYRISCTPAKTGNFHVTEIRDEDGKRSLRFTAPDGKTVLERVIANDGFHDTYYLYDALERLVGVIPPEAASVLSDGSTYYSDDQVMAYYGYWYAYDHRNLKTGVKLPGAEIHYIVYDGEGRQILRQDGNLRKRGAWMFLKYDRLGRPVLQGIVEDTRDRAAIAAIWEDRAVTETFSGEDFFCVGYTDDCKLGQGEYSVISAWFYDTYDFTGQLPIGTDYFPTELPENTRGLQTGMYEAVLNRPETGRTTLFTYDDKGRLKETYRSDFSSGNNSRHALHYDFQGLVTGEDNRYEGIANVNFRYIYDYAGRKTATRYQYINPKLTSPDFLPLSSMQYDSYGRLRSERALHDSITVNYGYYPDGTLKQIDNPGRFSELLCKSSAVTTPYTKQRCLNGNINDIRISQMGRSYFWHYEYDLADRLTLGMMYDAEAFNRQSGEGERFAYDKMGNITLLLRRHNGADVDCLNTVYRGNQIQRTGNVGGGNYDYDFPGYTDAADEETEVAYDANGNEIFNLDKEIVAIRYNVLNLPDTIQFANGNRIVNYYFAGGEKSGSVSRTYLTPLSVPLDEVTDSKDPHKDVSESKAGNLVCKNGSLSHILFDGGYFSLSRNYGGSMTNPKIYTYIRDHLGSIRLVCEGNTGEVVQSLEYFPSGLIFRSMCFEWQPYRFTGKELITEHGLNRYDSKARIQDFQIPGFTTLDPLCENYYGISPYSYCAGNPVSRVDPNGMKWDDPEEAKKLKKHIDDKITSLNMDINKNQAKLNKGGLKEKQITKLNKKISEAQDRISNLNVSKGDIDRLDADQNNIYSLSYISGGLHTVRQGRDNKICIETSSDALSIHEITHVRQSLDAGGLRFSSNGELLNAGIGIRGVGKMEIEAYQMQYSFDKSFPGSTGGKGLQGIDFHSVGNIRNGGTLVYPIIYQYSQDLIQFQKEQKRIFGIP